MAAQLYPSTDPAFITLFTENLRKVLVVTRALPKGCRTPLILFKNLYFQAIAGMIQLVPTKQRYGPVFPDVSAALPLLERAGVLVRGPQHPKVKWGNAADSYELTPKGERLAEPRPEDRGLMEVANEVRARYGPNPNSLVDATKRALRNGFGSLRSVVQYDEDLLDAAREGRLPFNAVSASLHRLERMCEPTPQTWPYAVSHKAFRLLNLGLRFKEELQPEEQSINAIFDKIRRNRSRSVEGQAMCVVGRLASYEGTDQEGYHCLTLTSSTGGLPGTVLPLRAGETWIIEPKDAVGNLVYVAGIIHVEGGRPSLYATAIAMGPTIKIPTSTVSASVPSDTGPFRVFLSSTFVDLVEERKRAEHVIHELGQQYHGMEYFGSQPDTPVEVCLSDVAASDVMVLIVGRRYGSGMTEKEYEAATRLGIPCLVFLLDEPARGSDALLEREPEDLAKMMRFRRRLQNERTVAYFKNPDELSSKVALSLIRWIGRSAGS